MSSTRSAIVFVVDVCPRWSVATILRRWLPSRTRAGDCQLAFVVVPTGRLSRKIVYVIGPQISDAGAHFSSRNRSDR